MKKLTRKEYIKELRKNKEVVFVDSASKKELKDNDMSLDEAIKTARGLVGKYEIEEVIEMSNQLKMKRKKDGSFVYHYFTAPNKYYLKDNVLIHKNKYFITFHKIY